jgi:hypothetical protein
MTTWNDVSVALPHGDEYAVIVFNPRPAAGQLLYSVVSAEYAKPQAFNQGYTKWSLIDFVPEHAKTIDLILHPFVVTSEATPVAPVVEPIVPPVETPPVVPPVETSLVETPPVEPTV